MDSRPPPVLTTGLPPPIPGTTGYFVDIEGETKGPYTIQQLRSLWSAGTITTETLWCKEWDAEWKPAAQLLPLLELPSPPAVAVHVLKEPHQRSRGVFIVLGLIFGALGVHNFYAGYIGRGFAQIMVTVLLGWTVVGVIAVIGWSFLEVLFVQSDANGVKMR